MLAKGLIYTLKIGAVSDPDVKAELSSGEITAAKRDKNARILTFTRELPKGLRPGFTGYLLDFDDADPLWRMEGIFGKEGGDPQSGWYATLPRS